MSHSNKTYLYFFFLFLFLLLSSYSCKNFFRDKIGNKIPKGEYAIVTGKTPDPFRGLYGGETNYYVSYRLQNGDDKTQLVTKHDYDFVERGDTIREYNNRTLSEKVVGVKNEEVPNLLLNFALRMILIFTIPFVMLVVGAKLFSLISDKLKKISNKPIVHPSFKQKKYKKIILSDTAWGIIIIITAIFLIFGLPTIVLWDIMRELPTVDATIPNLLKTEGLILLYIFITSLFFSGGNIAHSLMWWVISIIVLSVGLLFFHYVFGLDYEYMTKGVLSGLG